MQTHVRPLLLKKFPRATEEQLSEAQAYAYGGAIIQDMGYYPYGSPFFSDLTHYIRSGNFIQALLRDAKDIDEYAFSLGALAHYASDNDGHRIGINRAVPILYPRLRQKFGNSISFEDDKLAHIKTEFGFDVLEVARERFAPDSYHDFIGFEVSRSLLEQAFQETYGLELKNVLLSEDKALNSYRRDVSKLIPKATRIASDKPVRMMSIVSPLGISNEIRESPPWSFTLTIPKDTTMGGVPHCWENTRSTPMLLWQDKSPTPKLARVSSLTRKDRIYPASCGPKIPRSFQRLSARMNESLLWVFSLTELNWDPTQRLTGEQNSNQSFISKKNPCGVPFNTPHGFVFLSVRAVASGNETPAETRHIPRGDECPYWSNRPSPDLCKSGLPTFAGKLRFGCVGATSAIDLSILSSTGVARKAWISPV
jgi:hypothetical protein